MSRRTVKLPVCSASLRVTSVDRIRSRILSASGIVTCGWACAADLPGSGDVDFCGWGACLAGAVWANTSATPKTALAMPIAKQNAATAGALLNPALWYWESLGIDRIGSSHSARLANSWAHHPNVTPARPPTTLTSVPTPRPASSTTEDVGPA